MAAPTVVTLQPQYVVAGPNMSRAMWQTGLMDCCTDCGVCECRRGQGPLAGGLAGAHGGSPPCRLLWDVLLPLPGLPGGRGHERVLPLRDQCGHEDPVPYPIQHPGQCGRGWWAPFSAQFSLNPHCQPRPWLGTLHPGSQPASGNSQAQRATAWPLCPCQGEP